MPPAGARTIAALLTLRDHVIAPILAGVRSPRMGRKPKIWTAADRDYEALRIGMQTLFRHVGIETQPAAALERFLPWSASPEDLQTWAKPPPAGQDPPR